MLYKTLLLIVSIFIYACSDGDTTTSPETLDTVTGTVTYLDGSAVSQLSIQFLNLTTKRSYSGLTDSDGKFNVSNISEGKYELSTQGTTSLIYKHLDTINVSQSAKEFNFKLKFRYIDDQKVFPINDDLFFIKYNTFDTRVGSALDSIDFIAGYYRNDFANNYTLSSDIYLIPFEENLEELSKTADADYVRSNYTKLATLAQLDTPQAHVLIFTNNNVEVLYSNPSNGFAFVNADTTKILGIPCIDRANNDFGLEIFYK